MTPDAPKLGARWSVAALALVMAAPALAQEPSHLERLAGVCRTDRDVTLGRYAGRVLWTQDGQLSGMLSQAAEDAEAADVEGFRPRSLTIARQTPETTDEGLVLQSRAVFLESVDGEAFEATIFCTVSPTPPVRPDPGATSSG